MEHDVLKVSPSQIVFGNSIDHDVSPIKLFQHLDPIYIFRSVRSISHWSEKLAKKRQLSEGKKTLQKTLITLEIKGAEVEANGYEPIWTKNNKRIGMTTSGGYGNNIQKSLAMAFV